MANRMEQAVMDNDKRALNREINAIPYIASTTKRPKSAVPMSPWGRYGHRDTGTLAHIEKKRLELAGMAPTPQITWSPSNIPTPPWASPGGVRGRPASAPARGPPVYRMPPPSPPRPAPPRPSSPQARPSSPRPRPPPVESPWSVEAAAAEWTCNRGGGGCWSKAPVMSGTMAHIEKKRLELSATAPAPNLTRWPRPHSASRATGERGEGDGSPERSRSPQSSRYAAKAVSEYAHDATQARPELWRPLDLSALRLADLTQLQFLLSDPAAMEACGASRFPRAVPVEPPPAALDDEAEHAPATASRRPQRERYRRLAEVEAAPPVEAPPPEPMVRFEARSVTLSKNRLSNIEELPRLLSTLVLLDAPSLTLLDLSFNQIVRLPAALGLLRSLEVPSEVGTTTLAAPRVLPPRVPAPRLA